MCLPQTPSQLLQCYRLLENLILATDPLNLPGFWVLLVVMHPVLRSGATAHSLSDRELGIFVLDLARH